MQGNLFEEGPKAALAPKDPSRAAEAQASSPPAEAGAHALPADHGQRELSVTEFDRPIMLEAGAGTGKTATLVARVVCWCTGPGWEASQASDPKATPEEQAAAILTSIAAITFTEAAAAEMSTRVSLALAELERASAEAGGLCEERLPTGLSNAHLPGDVGLIQQRASALRSGLEHLNISTIHSFCRRLLASNPLEVGLAPGFEVDAKGQHQRASVRRAMEEYLAQAWQSPIDPDLLVLARQGFGAPEIEETLLELRNRGARAADFELDPFDEATVASLLQALEAEAKSLAAYLGGVFGGLPANQKIHDLIETLGELISILSMAAQGAANQEAAAVRLQALQADLEAAWSERSSGKLKDFVKGKLTKGEEKLLAGDSTELSARVAAFELAAAPFRSLNPMLLSSGRRILGRVLERVEADLRVRGVASFNDLLEDAHRLLNEHPEIASSERRRMGLLMVDEFQDTDQMQCDMVRCLALEGPLEERPSLFIVGDPKQSIFSWRSADLVAYDRFKSTLQEAGGELLQLTCNFRSTPAVLAEVTRVIEPIMQAETGVQPPYVALEAFRQQQDAQALGIEHWISWPKDPTSGAILIKPGRAQTPSYVTEAQAIAADISLRQAAGARWHDFALILRTMTHLEIYLDELRRLGIPFEVQTDRSYYRRREIIDASALVRAALDPSDLLALVSLLRSPMVGLPDAALLPLWERDFPGQLADLEAPESARLERLQRDLQAVAKALPESIPGLEGIRGWELSVMAAVEDLAELRAAFHGLGGRPSLGIDAWIDLLRAKFLPDVTEAARYLGHYRLMNLERFFEDLLEAFQEHAGDAQAVLRALRSNAKNNERVDTRLPVEEASDTVKVLTIHGSKGLEYPCVYLPQLHKADEAPDHRRSTSFDRRAGQVSYEIFRTGTPNRSLTESLRKRTERAERVRLFYVALTRAKDRLVLLSAWGSAGQPVEWDRATRYSQLLGHRSGSSGPLKALTELAQISGVEAHVDDSGVTWRLAARIEAGSGSLPARAQPIALPAMALLEERQRRLAEAQSAAEEHSQRPYGWQASRHASLGDGETLEVNSALESADWGAQALDAEARAASPEDLGLTPQSAMRVGTEIHHLLERFQSASEAAELAERLLGRLAFEFSDAEQASYREILANMAANGIFERLESLQPCIVARELPALLPPGAIAEPRDRAPVAFVSAAIDLVYRDPESEELVVVDYKTDRLQGEEQLMQRAQHYRTQGLTYVRALRQALELDYDPRLEFWFLRCGRVASLQAEA